MMNYIDLYTIEWIDWVQKIDYYKQSNKKVYFVLPYIAEYSECFDSKVVEDLERLSFQLASFKVNIFE